MIYVTVGTMFMDFPRLIKAMDDIARDSGERVVVQRGMGATIPTHCEHFDFKPHEEVLQIQREARLIVAHAGIGCAIDALSLGKPLILVPRRQKFEEHMDDHQLQIAEAVEKRGWGVAIHDVAQLADACANPPAAAGTYTPSVNRMQWAVRDVLDRVAIGKR